MKADSDRIIELFNQANAIATPEERARFLDEACRDDPEARAQIESLLQAEAPPREFLKLPSPPEVSLTEKPGDLIGRYKLLQQIGEGGGGVVYMAEQEEPVRRRVALKIIKLGMETREIVARFEAERQALAMMDHPSIAKVFDGGATASGRPYFVMELVRGAPITHYCDEHRLTTRQRLDLFVQVCQAVQHAHQKGIIHRDLKPSNVLVTELEGRPTPKVIDFGVAKATEQRLTEKTLFTRFGQLVGTPAYMSPEQAGFGGLDIDTRSDVYSLGVLLYELLTGRPPFDSKKLLEAGYEAILKTIREVEPPKPSTKLSTLSHEELAVTATQRNAEPGKLNGLVRGELDWIVMKALEKDRARRYETATSFAHDIERHLNNEPVVARPPSKLYEFQKTVRRHKFGFAATGAVILALTLGMGFSIWTLIKERLARQQAVAAERKAETVAQFLKNMLEGVGPSVALGRDTKLLREILDRTAERVGKDLTDLPEAELELRKVLAELYNELGLYPEMAEMNREMLRLAQKLYGDEHPKIAISMEQLGCALRFQEKFDEAEPLLRKALAMQIKLRGTNAITLVFLNNLGGFYEMKGNFAEAESLYLQALDGQRRLPDKEEVLVTGNNLAIFYGKIGRYADAERLYTNMLAEASQFLPTNHYRVFQLKGHLAEIYWRLDRIGEALPLSREACDGLLSVLGPDHERTLLAMNLLAGSLCGLGNYADAEPLFVKVLEARTKLLGLDHTDTLVSIGNLAMLYQRQGRYDLAEFHATNALARLRQAKGLDHMMTVSTAINLSGIYFDLRRLEEAETLLTNALPFARKIWLPGGVSRTAGLRTLSVIYLEQQRFKDAEPLQREVLAEQRARNPVNPNDLAQTLATLSATLLKTDQPGAAEPFLLECLKLREQTIPDHWLTFNTCSQLGRAMFGQRKYADARIWLHKGYDGMKAREDQIPEAGKIRLKEAMQSLAQLYEQTSQPEQAAEWNRKLADMDKAESATPASVPSAK